LLQDEFITFVNHASVIFSHKNIRLITDPWLFGPAFNNGWELLSPSKFDINDFDNITHIWFSHEHPDHFSIQVLNAIPENIRKKITILFQNTLDHRVAKKCEQLKFKQVIEMKSTEYISLNDEFKIKCVPNSTYDSWFYAIIGDKKILNINDCMVDSNSQSKIVKRMIGDVDILLTQFGYASWVGNPEDVQLRVDASREKLQRIQIQDKIFQPKFIIPFASFVRFSHKDNHYMNDQMNRIENVEKFIHEKTNSVPIILHPGDIWSGKEKIDNSLSINKYADDLQKNLELYDDPKIIKFDELQKLASAYIDDIKKRNNLTFVKLLHNLHFFKTTNIFLKDLNISVSFNLIDGLKKSVSDKLNVDIITDSDSLSFVFSWDYGVDTLFVNGRFRTSGGKIMNFFRLFLIGTLNNNGRTFPLGVLGFLLNERSMWKTKFLEIILGKYDLK
jgi:L-ascorbate metabolism protein UlaG (beta-lactamase superfamily)